MPLATGFETPTWDALVTRISADFVTRLSEDAYIPRSWQWALVRVTAGVSYALHGVAAFVARQAVADRSDDAGLVRHAKVFGLGRAPSALADGDFIFTGTVGTILPAGTEIQHSTTAWRFATDAEATIGGAGFVVTAATAIEAGEGGNEPNSAIAYTLVSPVVGINSTCYPSTFGPAGGTDLESVEDLRERFVGRLRNPPHGGAAHDYMRWAREALETVDAVWVVKGAVAAGPPLAIDVPVTVYFTLKGTGVATIPGAGPVTTVDAYLEPRAPEGASPAATAPVGVAVTLTINPATAYDTAAQRAAVVTALHALMARKNRERQRDIFGAVAAIGTVTVYNSELRTTIGSIMEQFTLTSVNGDGTGLSNVPLTAAQAAYLSTVTWV